MIPPGVLKSSQQIGGDPKLCMAVNLTKNLCPLLIRPIIYIYVSFIYINKYIYIYIYMDVSLNTALGTLNRRHVEHPSEITQKHRPKHRFET